MNKFTMTIGGEAASAASTFSVINPATGVPFADAPACSPEQLDRAVEAAQGAFPSWEKDEKKERRGALVAASAALRSNSEALATTLTREQGKPWPRHDKKWRTRQASRGRGFPSSSFRRTEGR